MKIAVNARFLLKNRLEGIGLFTHEVMKRLVQQHPEVEFLFFFDRPFDTSFIYGPNVTPIVLFPPARHPFLFLWWFEWSVAKALKKHRADVFFSPDNFLSLRTPTPTLLVTHDIAHVHFPDQLSFFHKNYYLLFAPKFNRRADHIIAVSEFTKQDLMQGYGLPSEKISVACNGCREIFKPLQATEIQAVRNQFSEGQPYFFYVGAVHPRKNVHRLIAAFDQFKTATGAPVKLLIAGRFAWKAGEVQDAFKASKHQPDIHFLGYVNDEDLAKLMAAAFACTYISLFEGFGVPVLEAMHCDVPIITSNVSSLPEVAGPAALLVDPFSEWEIAAAMQQIWENEHLREKLITLGKSQRQQFTWQKATDIVWENLQISC